MISCEWSSNTSTNGGGVSMSAVPEAMQCSGRPRTAKVGAWSASGDVSGSRVPTASASRPPTGAGRAAIRPRRVSAMDGGHTVTVTIGRRSEQDIRSWPPDLEDRPGPRRRRRDDRADANLHVAVPRVDVPPTNDAAAADETIRELIAAHELERSRLARDLHDVVGQALTAIRLHLDLIRKDESAGRTVGRRRTKRSSSSTRPCVRFVTSRSRSGRRSLTTSGSSRQPRMSDAAGTHLRLRARSSSADVPDSLLDVEIEAACFRTLQEALTNIGRHAAASIVEVSITACGERIGADGRR